MNTAEMERLRPDLRALAILPCPEVKAALPQIEAAHSVLVTETNEARERLATRQADKKLRAGQEYVDHAWLLWKAGPFRRYHTARLAAAEVVTAALRRMEAEERTGLAERTDRLGVALGKLLHDEGAGHTLVALLCQIAGPLQGNPTRQSAYHQWHMLEKMSKNALREVPPESAYPENQEAAARATLAAALNPGKEG